MASANEAKKHPITPQQPPSKRRRKPPTSECDCGLAFCRSGEVQKLLSDYGCKELLEFRHIVPLQPSNKESYRKHYAFRKAAEIQLQIPENVRQDNKRYHIHKFHWPVALLQLQLRTTTLINPIMMKKIVTTQSSLYGITNSSLSDKRNNYGHLIKHLIKGTELSAMEMLDLRFQVQAPVATKTDIYAYVATLSWPDPGRFHATPPLTSQVNAASIGNELTPATDVGVTTASEVTPPSDEATDDSPATPKRTIPTPSLASTSTPSQAPATPERQSESFFTSLATPNDASAHDDTNISVDNAGGSPMNASPIGDTCASPLTSRRLFTTIEPTTVPDIVPTESEIVDALGISFKDCIENGQPIGSFLQSKPVITAWQTLARVYHVEQPILIKQRNSSTDKNYWLFLCQCGNDAFVGTINRGSCVCRIDDGEKKSS